MKIIRILTIIIALAIAFVAGLICNELELPKEGRLGTGENKPIEVIVEPERHEEYDRLLDRQSNGRYVYDIDYTGGHAHGSANFCIDKAKDHEMGIV